MFVCVCVCFVWFSGRFVWFRLSGRVASHLTTAHTSPHRTAPHRTGPRLAVVCVSFVYDLCVCVLCGFVDVLCGFVGTGRDGSGSPHRVPLARPFRVLLGFDVHTRSN